MKGEKMLRVLQTLRAYHISLNSVDIYSNSGGEIVIAMPQPHEEVHKYLLKREFVLVDDSYIYRPIIRRKQ